MRRASGESGPLDERTWCDLDLDDVFRRVDRTTSAVGRQCLYARLRRPLGDVGPLLAFDELIGHLSSSSDRSAAVRRELVRLSGRSAYGLPLLLLGELPERPAWYLLFPLLTLTAAAAIVASFLFPPALLFLAAVCAANILVRLSYRKRIAAIVPSLPALRNLVRAAIRLERLGDALPDRVRRALSAVIPRVTPLLRTTSWLVFETERTADLSQLFYEYANLVLLLDVNAFFFSLELLRKVRGDLRIVYETIGEIDGALAVASFRSKIEVWCRPRFEARSKSIRMEGAFHPLLASPVANSIRVEGSSVLITGSNMSGKTTFIKTVGVNAILARTIHTCAARSFENPPAIVFAAIGRSESLMEGKSYYLAEVERIRDLVVAAESGSAHLFLLDELFRGTNTLERVGAGKAVLANLNRGENITFVATHDIELVPLLAGAYVPYHFRESLQNGSLSFDYTLHPGPSSTRNAIALLKSAGFPDDLVRDALETVDLLKEQGLAAATRRPSC